MLLDKLVNFCDKRYSAYKNECGCESGTCNHPEGKCSGSCYECLYHVHFPDRAPTNAKRIYDCKKMLYHYVCQYSYLYTTEILCGFDYKWEFIKDFSTYNILSVGCGGCADLMAMECLLREKGANKKISYCGVDINNLWMDIHDEVKNYCNENNMFCEMHYEDAFTFFPQHSLSKINVIVISYFISYLYNTNQIDKIKYFAECLSKKAIGNKGHEPLLFIINDVNSNKRGRDYFNCFANIMKNNFTVNKCEYKYFETNKLNDMQKIGNPYAVKNVSIDIPQTIIEKYHAHKSVNSAIQLLMEVM